MFTPPDCCTDCYRQPNGIVCRCLQVTEETVVHAVAVLGCSTIQELRKETGAGTGCNCCHIRLRQYLKAGQRLSLALAE
jgi:NAD(P)H-nitrite reductase large subunit